MLGDSHGSSAVGSRLVDQHAFGTPRAGQPDGGAEARTGTGERPGDPCCSRWACCLPRPRPRPRRPDRSSSASSRGRRSMPRTSGTPPRAWPPPGSGRTASCSLGVDAAGPGPTQMGRGGQVHRPARRRAGSGSLPAVWGNPDWVAGWRRDAPARRAEDSRRGRNFLKALVARYGRTAATGGAATASSTARAPRRCRSRPGRSGTSPI